MHTALRFRGHDACCSGIIACSFGLYYLFLLRIINFCLLPFSADVTVFPFSCLNKFILNFFCFYLMISESTKLQSQHFSFPGRVGGQGRRKGRDTAVGR